LKVIFAVILTGETLVSDGAKADSHRDVPVVG
jgi:hypothetical protein